MDIIFFLNSITEFNHSHPILDQFKVKIVATESQELFSHIKQNYPQIRVTKLQRKFLSFFKPKIVIFSGNWSIAQIKNIFSKRPKYKRVQIFHGIIDKKRIYAKTNFKDSTSLLFKAFYFLLKLKIRRLSPLSENPYSFIDNLEIDRLVPNRYDLILISGKEMARSLLKKRLLTPYNYAKIGIPKTDALFDESLSRRDILRGLGLDDTKKTVLYAPTWSTSPNLCLSSIPNSGVAVCQAIPEDVNFIFKSHANVKRLNEFPIQIRKMQEIILKNQNMKFLDSNIDAVLLMRISDLLITDFSSVAIEYLLLDRPLIFLDHVGKNYSDPNLLDIKIRKAGEIVNNNKLLADTIIYCLKHPEKKSKIRKQLAKNLVYFADGKSAIRAAETIRSLLR